MPEGTILVTGASRGIGAAITSDLVRRGFRVAGLSRSGQAVAGEAYSCDVSNEDSLRSTIEAIAAKGPIGGLVNNAGIHRATPSDQMTLAEFQETLTLNTTAVFIACREVYPHIKATGSGTIVNIGSFFDKLGVPENAAYCASKAAVGALTRCFAAEWAKDHIRVLDVAPGYIETGLNRDFLAKDKVKVWLGRRIPVGRVGSADEVARLVGSIFAENIGFLTGETIYLDGGQGMNH
jgi:NAD(P)-dependent dehydrogenase (short-subunit alcohol dehydrogenase family)